MEYSTFSRKKIEVERKLVKSQKDGKIEVEVRIAEALTRDVGRGIARVDPDIVSKMGWVSGDVIEIEGNKKTYGLLWQGPQNDFGQGVIRIDGATRNSAGVGIDDRVVIRKTHAVQANHVTFAPTEPLGDSGLEEYLQEELPRASRWTGGLEWRDYSSRSYEQSDRSGCNSHRARIGSGDCDWKYKGNSEQRCCETREKSSENNV